MFRNKISPNLKGLQRNAKSRWPYSLNFVSRNYVLFHFLMPYIIVLVIPLIMGLIYYFMTARVVETDIEESNMAILKQCSQILDQRFDEVNSVVNQIASNQYVKNLQNVGDAFQYPNLYKIISTRESLYNYKASNQFILDYFILFNNSQLALNNTIAYKYKDFYDLYFSYKKIGFEQWQNSILGEKIPNGFMSVAAASLNMPDQVGSASKTDCNVITYLQPLVSTNVNSGYIMLIIDDREIEKLLSELNINGGTVLIENGEGTVLTSMGAKGDQIQKLEGYLKSHVKDGAGRADIGGKKMIVTNLSAATNGLHYVCYQPEDAVYSKLSHIRVIIWLFLALSVLFGILASLLLAHKSSKPINDILLDMPLADPAKKGFNLFASIKGMISDLAQNNESLAETIALQKPFMRASFFARLFKGEFTSEDEIGKLIRYTGVNLPGTAYSVLIFKYCGHNTPVDETDLDNLNRFKIIIKDNIENILHENSVCYDIDEDKVALLFASVEDLTRETGEQILSFVSQMKCSMTEIYFNHIIVSIGGTVHKLIDVSASYDQARNSLSYHINKAEGNIIWYRNLNMRDEAYYFPQEIQTRLINHVKSGDREKTKILLNDLFSRNILNKSLAFSVQKLFTGELWAIIVKLAGKISVNDGLYQTIMANLNKSDRLGELDNIRMISLCFDTLCCFMQKQNENQSRTVIDDVKLYIRQSYQQADLSLSSIASRYRINEAYLSYLFKQHTEQNFSVFLENLRMEKAMELITETSLPINDVAVKVGYYSTNTFCRAFKRVKGISATACRKSKKDDPQTEDC